MEGICILENKNLQIKIKLFWESEIIL